MLTKVSVEAGRPVSLEEAKAQLRVDHDDEDDKINLFLDAAAEYVAHQSGLTLWPTVYRIDRADWWGGCLNVLTAPVSSIDSVKYVDADGEEQTVESTLYRWYRTAEGAIIDLLSAFTSPVLQTERRDAVRVTFSAGYQDGSASPVPDAEFLLPQRARQAILMLVSHWYDEARGMMLPVQMSKAPASVDALIAQLRIYR